MQNVTCFQKIITALYCPWMTKLICDLGLMLGYVMRNQERYMMLLTKRNKENSPSTISAIPKVHITPSSFRIMNGHHEVVDGKLDLVNDVDQTIVTVRPKYYIGSSGSVWASETMLLRRELSQLFEVAEGPYRSCSNPLRRFCVHVHDSLFYFQDTTMYEDVMTVAQSDDCKFRKYEMSRLSLVKSHLLQALKRWDEDKLEVQGEDIACGNELKDSVTTITDTLKEKFSDVIATPREELWEMFEHLLKKVEQTQNCIKELNLPPVKPDILKATDAGPGVGSSNVEDKFQEVEMARIFNSDRVNRIYRARDDSGQNEAERSNACIGEALVDGDAMRWQYYEAFDGLTQKEIQALSLDDVKKREELPMEQNVWRVAKDVAERINHEPGPAGDFMQSYLSSKRDAQFFFNTEHLRQFVSSAESKQNDIPGCAYFKKISVFLKRHVQVGELYLEYFKGACQETSATLCDFCTRFPRSIQDLKRVPRPMPDKKVLPDLR